MQGEIHELILHMHSRTEKAILVSDDGDRAKAVWLPLSQIQFDETRLKLPAVIVTLPEWLAVDKGLL